MKRTLLISTLVMALLVLAATVGMAADYKIGFSNASVSNTWRVAFYNSYKAETANYPNIKFYYTNANDNVAKQISDVEDLMVKGINALIISSATADALNSVIEKAYDRGIKVVLVDRMVTTDKYDTFIKTDDRDLGRRVANAMVADLYKKYGTPIHGKVAIIQGFPGAGPTIERQKGFMDVLNLYPGIDVVASVAADFQRAKGKSVMEDILQSNEQVDAVISHSGESLAGAIEAEEDAGRLNDIKNYAVDGYNGVLKAIKAGKAEFTDFFPVKLGEVAVQTAVKLLNGEEVGKFINVYGPSVNKDNVDKFVKPNLPDSAWVY